MEASISPGRDIRERVRESSIDMLEEFLIISLYVS